MSRTTPTGPSQQMPPQQPWGNYPQGPGGPQFPYGPPPRKKRHWVRNIFLGVVGLIVLIVVIAVATSGSSVSTTPSGQSSSPQASGSAKAAHPAKAAGLGAYFDVKDDSGDTYRVTLVKVVDPAQGADEFTTPDNGTRFVGAVFTIKAINGSPKDEDANNDAALVGSNGQTYNADIASIQGYTNFSEGQINVAQGDTATGSVAFQVPNGVKVSKIQWSASSGFGSTVQWNAR